MTKRHTIPALLIALLAASLLLSPPIHRASAQDTRPATDPDAPRDREEQSDQKDDSEVVVGRLTYDKGKTAVCFADQFLATYARETQQNVRRGYTDVNLDSPDLFEHPFVLFSGQETFTLSEAEQNNLRKYIERGGFVLASAGCSNAAWAGAFEKSIEQLFGEDALTPLGTDHALFHTVYDIDHIDVRREGVTDPVLGLVRDGRVRLVYSPLGLNDTSNAGGDCCCCGGSEIKNARLINVNALGYALTR